MTTLLIDVPRLVRSPGDPAESRVQLVALLDDAHRTLEARDLAGLLLAVRRLVVPAELWAEVPLPMAPSLSPAARACLRLVERICFSPLAPRDALRGTELGAWLDAYVHEVAARPKGAAAA
jgi:hypothetical protein